MGVCPGRASLLPHAEGPGVSPGRALGRTLPSTALEGGALLPTPHHHHHKGGTGVPVPLTPITKGAPGSRRLPHQYKGGSPGSGTLATQYKGENPGGVPQHTTTKGGARVWAPTSLTQRG